MKSIFRYSSLLVAALLLTIFIKVDGLYAAGPKHGQHHFKIMQQLNDEQRDEVKSMITEMKESDATREEIRDAVREKLQEYGVELPAKGEGFEGRGFFGPHRGFPMIDTELSENQRTAIKEKVESLREQGASREEIHDEIKQMLENYGIEVPEHSFDRPRRGMRHGWKFFGADLSDEQKKAIKDKVDSMRKNKASREEIHEAVTKMLKDYGIEIPKDLEQHRKFMKNLPDEQRKEVRDTIRKMRKDGASREEIQDTIKKLIYESGIDANSSGNNSDTAGKNTKDKLNVQNFPNPFNPETTIKYEIHSGEQVNVQIFDVQGKLIRSLLNDYQSTGTHTIRWDGLNENGNQVPSGVYFLRITAGSETVSKRIVMTK